MTAAQQLSNAKVLAQLLASVIKENHLYVTMKYKKKSGGYTESIHVYFEGWTTAGALAGQVLGESVFPVSVWTRRLDPKIHGAHGWEARVEARGYSGALMGAAEGMCSRMEEKWATAPDYQVRSMAQTRAGSKALRIALGWIISLAGFQATPAEEMLAEGNGEEKGKAPARRSQAPRDGKDDETKEQDATFGLATKMWPDTVKRKSAYYVIATVLHLPATGEKAVAEYWLKNGGTWGHARAAMAEVRRIVGEDGDLTAAINQVDAYGKLTAGKEEADTQGQQPMPV